MLCKLLAQRLLAIGKMTWQLVVCHISAQDNTVMYVSKSKLSISVYCYHWTSNLQSLVTFLAAIIPVLVN